MKMKKYISLLAIVVLSAGFMWSCNKKTDILGTYVSSKGLAYVKIIHAAPTFRQVTNTWRDSFNVYANGIKVNATFLTYNSAFPSSNPYYAVPAGPQSIRIALQGSALNPDSVTLASFNKTLEANSYYSFIVTDSLLKGNEAKQIFIKDVFALTDTGHFTLRFVHALLNDTLNKNVDIFSVLYNKNIFSDIAPGTVTGFINLPFTTASETLIVRRPGSTFELARLSPASFGRAKAYTIVYRGLPGTAFNSTTAPRGRNLIQYSHF
jgi:hypothetical protein